MGLLLSKEFYKDLTDSLERSKEAVVIFSAFVKENALLALSEYIDKSIDVYVIARFQKRDIVVGATDLVIYEICKKNGWKLGIDLNLHGKLFMFDYKKILLGSANLTTRGMSINMLGNLEFGVSIRPTDIDILKIEDLLKKIVWINDELYEKLKKEIVDITKEEKIEDLNWSHTVQQELYIKVDYLWVNDLPYTDPRSLLTLDMNNNDHMHDYYMYSLDIDTLNEAALKSSFMRSRAFLWVKEILSDGESANFGKITSLLHDALLDDPKPYRKSVKEFVARLFQWVEFVCDDIRVVQYEKTKSMALVS